MTKWDFVIYLPHFTIANCYYKLSTFLTGDTRGRAQALADLGRAHLAMGACGSAVSYLRQALAATEGLADADEEV